MTELRLVVLPSSDARAFDGVRWLAVAAVPTGGTGVVGVLDPAGTRDVRARLGPDFACLDLGARLRSLGFAPTPDALSNAMSRLGGGPVWPEDALWDLGFGQTPLSYTETKVIESITRRNDVGLRIDRALARELAAEYRSAATAATAELDTILPGVGRASDAVFRAAVEEKLGVEVSSTRLGALPGLAGRMIDARQQAVAFENACRRMTELARGSGVLRDFLRPFGAHTGRMTSSGFSLHNLPVRPHPLLRSLVKQRGVILPDEGRWFVSRDLSGIEARVLAFLAGETELLARFQRGEDVYAWFASLVWPGEVIQKGGLNAHLREIGKQAVLAIGFGEGLLAFIEHVLDEVPDADVPSLERAYRLYWDSFTAIRRAHDEVSIIIHLATDGVRLVGRKDRVLHCDVGIDADANLLSVRLPSGRHIWYRDVLVAEDADGEATLWYADFSRGDTSLSRSILRVPRSEREHRFEDGVVRRKLAAHALVNNVVQATALDLLVHQQAALLQLGVDTPLSVHDELVALSADDDEAWEETQRILSEVMGRVPASLPRLAGLPLATSPNKAVRERYA